MKKKDIKKHAAAVAELMKKLDAITTDAQREESRLDAHYRLNAIWRDLNKARATNPSQK